MSNQPTAAEQKPSNASSLWKAAFIGGAIGAAAALLFAPKPGRELRRELKEKADEAYSSVKTHAVEWSATARDTAKAAGEQAGIFAGKLKQIAVDAKQAAGEELQHTREQIAAAGEQQLEGESSQSKHDMSGSSAGSTALDESARHQVER